MSKPLPPRPPTRCGASGTPPRADLVELRLDLLDRPDADAALAGRTPAGHRHLPGGLGRRPLPAAARPSALAILTRALALGADYVDLEWKAAAALEHWPAEARARVVLSSHDFEGVPADLAGPCPRHARGTAPAS